MSYPEHEKLHKVKKQSQAIGEFLEWLRYDKEIFLATHDICFDGEDDYDDIVPYHYNTEEILAEFFEINLKVLEEEKLQMLEEIRKMNS